MFKNQLNVRHIIKIGYNIIGKMERLKSLGYKYTDFKPENIIVDENGKIYIIDFGGAVGVEYSTKEYSPPIILFHGTNYLKAMTIP